jgi:hypothetical protein
MPKARLTGRAGMTESFHHFVVLGSFFWIFYNNVNPLGFSKSMLVRV